MSLVAAGACIPPAITTEAAAFCVHRGQMGAMTWSPVTSTIRVLQATGDVEILLNYFLLFKTIKQHLPVFV